jgi:hypothetical protein
MVARAVNQSSDLTVNHEDPMSVPVKIVVVYHSGYGHTVKIAEAVARGAAASGRWEFIDNSDAIIMGADRESVRQSPNGALNANTLGII